MKPALYTEAILNVIAPLLVLTFMVPINSYAQATKTALKAADLQIVISILQDDKATSLQKDRLSGKLYRGTVTVTDVVRQRFVEKPAIEVESDLGKMGSFYRKLSFEVKDFDKAAQLRKGDHIVITGRLTGIKRQSSGYINVADTEGADFADVVIEEISPPESKGKNS